MMIVAILKSPMLLEIVSTFDNNFNCIKQISYYLTWKNVFVGIRLQTVGSTRNKREKGAEGFHI